MKTYNHASIKTMLCFITIYVSFMLNLFHTLMHKDQIIIVNCANNYTNTEGNLQQTSLYYNMSTGKIRLNLYIKYHTRK